MNYKKFFYYKTRFGRHSSSSRYSSISPGVHCSSLQMASSVAIGMYFRVLIVLGLQDDLLLIARDDILGRKLQDAGLITPRRSSKRPPINR